MYLNLKAGTVTKYLFSRTESDRRGRKKPENYEEIIVAFSKNVAYTCYLTLFHSLNLKHGY